MVANITTGRNIYGALAYNQQKVDKGQASILSTSQIREPAYGHYDVMQAAEELLAWMPSYVRTEKPVVQSHSIQTLKTNSTTIDSPRSRNYENIRIIINII